MRTIDHFSNVDNNIHIVLDSTTSNPLKDVIVDVDADGVTIVSSNISNNHELFGDISILSTKPCPGYSILREHIKRDVIISMPSSTSMVLN